MKKIFLLAMAICMAFVASGCTYTAAVKSVQGVNVYSAYEEKIPGKYAIVFNNDRNLLVKDVSASSYQCSAHTYNVTFTSSFVSSITAVHESLFESIVSRNIVPSVDEMKRDGLSGYILIQPKIFEPRVSFIPGFWSVKGQATTTVGFDYIIRNAKNEMLATGTISGERTDDGDPGYGCGRGSEIIASSAERAMRDVLERYGERISNSTKLRGK